MSKHGQEKGYESVSVWVCFTSTLQWRIFSHNVKLINKKTRKKRWLLEYDAVDTQGEKKISALCSTMHNKKKEE